MERATIIEVLEHTWPATTRVQAGSFVFRQSDGGGKRVSATSVTGPVDASQIAEAEARMVAMGQDKLFTLDPTDKIDPILAELGYQALDETRLYHCAIEVLTAQEVPSVTAFPVWPPLQLANDIWTEAGIGADRMAVMERVKGPKTAILGRVNDRAGGVVFAAVHKECGMIHALEVLPFQRRNGLATSLTLAAAHWAAAQGATQFALPAVAANDAAHALYTSLGMRAVASYHYRIKP
ncbi:GNAT family N-acetyltransferase [Litoreibacter sp.]|nr:GNAT family N-acetyltransferase [Litoreibacter sp.]